MWGHPLTLLIVVVIGCAAASALFGLLKALRGPVGMLAYGVGLAPNTEQDGRRAHGIDERIPAAWLRPGLDFFDRLVRTLAK